MKNLKGVNWILIVFIILFIIVSESLALTQQRASDTLKDDYDVIVVGAGTGGVSAAIQAARLGARVALLEETDWIGGQMSTAGVCDIDDGLLADRGICGEIMTEIKEYYKEISNIKENQKNKFEPNVAQNILYEMIKAEKDKGCTLDVSLRTTVKSVLTTKVEARDTVKGLEAEIVTPSGASIIKKIYSWVVIDATECGDVIPLTPARYRVGNIIAAKEGDVRVYGYDDGNRWVKVNNIDDVYMQDITYTAVIRKYKNAELPEMPAMSSDNAPNPITGYVPIGYADFPDYYKYEFLEEKFPEIVSNAEGANDVWGKGYPVTWPVHNAYRSIPDSSNTEDYVCGWSTADNMERITKTIINWANDYPAVKPYTNFLEPKLSIRYFEERDYRKKANLEAKLKTLQFLYYAHKELGQNRWSVDNTAGFDTPYNEANWGQGVIPSDFKKIVTHFSQIPYIRESRRLVGLHTLTAEEARRVGEPPKANIKFPLAVAIGCYGMDLHNACEYSDLEPVDQKFFKEKVKDTSLTGIKTIAHPDGPFQVPFECLIPEEVDGLLAAEKNISVTRLVNGATRLHGITMLTGQAAGVIAAISAKQEIQARALNPITVQDVLLDAASPLSLYEFIDVSREHPLWKYIQLVSLYEIMIGYGNGYFGVNDSLLRRHAAVVLVKTFEIPVPAQAQGIFEDVPVTDPQVEVIEALYNAGITSGTSLNPKLFSPDAVVCRASFAVMLIKALGLDLSQAPTEPVFNDVPSIHWAFKYIQLMYAEGITAGCVKNGNLCFCPGDPLSRGQAAVFLMKGYMLKNKNKNTATQPSIPLVKDEGKYTTKTDRLYASWTSEDKESGIVEYQYKITEGSLNGLLVRSMTSTGTDNSITAGALSLIPGRTYYFGVRAKNGVGLWSKVGYSNGITVNIPPTVGYISPSSGSSVANVPVTFTTTYSDANGWKNIINVFFLSNTAIKGGNCLYVYYNQNTNKLYLRNNTNTMWLGGFAPGLNKIIENSYARLDCSKTIVSGNGPTLTVRWNVTFKSTFTGTKNTYLNVRDDSGTASGWHKRGTWIVK